MRGGESKFKARGPKRRRRHLLRKAHKQGLLLFFLAERRGCPLRLGKEARSGPALHRAGALWRGARGVEAAAQAVRALEVRRVEHGADSGDAKIEGPEVRLLVQPPGGGGGGSSSGSVGSRSVELPSRRRVGKGSRGWLSERSWRRRRWAPPLPATDETRGNKQRRGAAAPHRRATSRLPSGRARISSKLSTNDGPCSRFVASPS